MRRGCVTVVGLFSRNVSFTEHSKILEDEAKARGYTRNLWLDARQTEISGVRSGERAVTLVVPKVMELVNLSQVVLQEGAGKPFNFKTEPPTHSSVVTTKPYQGAFASSLDAAAAEKGFTSKWWLAPNKLGKYRLQLTERQRPVKLYLNVRAELFNADQLQKSDAFDYRPISAMTGHFYSAESPLTAELMKYNEKMGAKSGLLFTTNQLAAYRLSLKPGTSGLTVANADPTSRFTLFSVEDLEDYEKILASLNRTAVPTEPRLLMTGQALQDSQLSFSTRQNKYVVNGRDVVMNGWKLKPTARPEVTSKYSQFQTYSVMELLNPSEGYALALTKPPA